MPNRRNDKKVILAVTTDEATSTLIDVHDMAGGSVEIPTGSSIVSLEVFATHDAGGTPVELYDQDGGGLTLTVGADGVYELPDAIFSVSYISLKGSHAGAATAVLKS